jgi:predicted N-acetyltransferase YhbS
MSRYGFWQNIRYRSNYSKAVIHLQADLNNIIEPPQIFPFKTRKLVMGCSEDVLKWAEIVNEAYQEDLINETSALNFLRNHRFLDNTMTFFVLDENEPVATISVGPYKSDNHTGGDARLAVLKKYEGKGLGSFLVRYGFHKLKEQGIKRGESIISLKRTPSIRLHMKCGFIPEFNRKRIIDIGQKRFFYIHWLANRKVNRLFKTHVTNTLEPSKKR